MQWIKGNVCLENNIHYDYVIRLRYDVAPRKKLICSNYDPNFIYYQDLKQPDNIISDWFNFGSNTIMNVYSSMFLHFNYINSYQYLKKEDRDQTELNDFLFHILTKRRNHIQAVLPSANFNALEVAIKL